MSDMAKAMLVLFGIIVAWGMAEWLCSMPW